MTTGRLLLAHTLTPAERVVVNYVLRRNGLAEVSEGALVWELLGCVQGMTIGRAADIIRALRLALEGEGSSITPR